LISLSAATSGLEGDVREAQLVREPARWLKVAGAEMLESLVAVPVVLDDLLPAFALGIVEALAEIGVV
jgi:hypothetical protein